MLLRNDSSRGGVSELSMTTANGYVLSRIFRRDANGVARRPLHRPVDSVISLSSFNQPGGSSSLGIGGNFKIAGSTALGAVNLDVANAPERSCIHASAQTAMAPASVRMCETFEGQFGVSTSMGQAMVFAVPRDVGLRRNVVLRECSFTNVHGTIIREREGRSRGSVLVSSSMGSTKLIL